MPSTSKTIVDSKISVGGNLVKNIKIGGSPVREVRLGGNVKYLVNEYFLDVSDNIPTQPETYHVLDITPYVSSKRYFRGGDADVSFSPHSITFPENTSTSGRQITATISQADSDLAINIGIWQDPAAMLSVVPYSSKAFDTRQITANKAWQIDSDTLIYNLDGSYFYDAAAMLVSPLSGSGTANVRLTRGSLSGKPILSFKVTSGDKTSNGIVLPTLDFNVSSTLTSTYSGGSFSVISTNDYPTVTANSSDSWISFSNGNVVVSPYSSTTADRTGWIDLTASVSIDTTVNGHDIHMDENTTKRIAITQTKKPATTTLYVVYPLSQTAGYQVTLSTTSRPPLSVYSAPEEILVTLQAKKGYYIYNGSAHIAKGSQRATITWQNQPSGAVDSIQTSSVSWFSTTPTGYNLTNTVQTF